MDIIKYYWITSKYVHTLEFFNKKLIFFQTKDKLATLVEGDLKATFSIATTLRCSGGCYFIPWIASLYPWSVPYSAEC